MNTTRPSSRWHHGLRNLSTLLAGLLCATGVLAEWQWRDASGSRVFSDTPPPPNITEQQIIKRPGNQPAPAPVAAPPSNPASTPAGSAPAKPGQAPAAGRDPQLESKVKQSEEAKRKAEEQRLAQAKSENCQRARQAKATLDSGQRISRVNAQGEREFLDEATIAAERQRAQRGIDENCR